MKTYNYLLKFHEEKFLGSDLDFNVNFSTLINFQLVLRADFFRKIIQCLRNLMNK